LAKATQKWLSAALVISLLVALIPARVQAAAASIMITGLYTTTDAQVNQTTGKPIDDTKINRFTSNPIEVRANITGISEEQIQNIYYEIYNPDTKQTKVEKLNKATLVGSQIVFSNINLTEGLNRITLKMGTDSTGVSSQPGWAYLTSVSNITNLKIGEEVFVDGGMYPKNPVADTTNSLTITGSAKNSTSVEASAMGVPGTQTTSFPDGFFTFVIKNDESIDGSAFSGFNLKAGDNQLTFVASNSGTLSSFRVQRSFVYDNGKAFAFHTNVTPKYVDASNNVTYGSAQLLGSAPTVDSEQLKLDTDFKIPLVNGVLQYDTVKISVPGQADIIETIPSASVKLNNAYSSSQYQVFSYTNDFLLLKKTHRQLQTVSFTFSNSVNPDAKILNQNFSVTYVDPSSPSILSVGIGAPAATVDSEFRTLDPTTDITELPRNFRIKTVGAQKVEVKLDGGITNAGLAVDTSDSKNNYVDFTLDQMLDGQHTLTLTPYIGSVDPLNSVTYTINVNVAPYVFLTNLTKGQVFTAIYPFSNNGNLLFGRLVNVAVNEMTNVQVTVNDNPARTITEGELIKTNDADPSTKTGQFQFKLASDPSNAATAYKFQNGINTIKIVIYSNNVAITKTTYEFFYYANSAPSFSTVYPYNDKTNDFIPGSVTDTYSTQLDKVVLKGKMTGATSLKLTARANNALGLPVSKSVSIDLATKVITAVATGDGSEWGSDDFLTAANVSATDFSTLPITLSHYGETTFEFEITNESNIKVTQTVTIRREPMPYIITYPALITNSKGGLQANITSNYQTIEMTSEGTDQILFGKDQAKVVEPGKSFTYEARDLKAGANSLKFTVVKGKSKTMGTIILNYANTPVENARYKSKLKSSDKIFNGKIQYTFPKNTFLMRNDTTKQPDLYSERYLLFGIANSTTGQLVDRDIDANMKSDLLTSLLVDRTGRFQPASDMFYIDAGYVSRTETSPDSADKGGQLPFAPSILNSALKLPNYDPTYLFYTSRIPTNNLVTNQIGKLTLKYDPNITESAWRYVTVMHFGYHEDETGTTSSSPSWKNIGGVVDTKNNTITVPFQEFGYYRVFYLASSWEDVINHPWARNELDTLYAKGYMYNLQDNAFSPNENITRGEFATLLVKIFDLPLNYSGKLTFVDVSPTQSTRIRDYRYIETAARAGIIRGITEQSFAPTLSITRQDAAVMIARAAKLKLGTDPDKSLASLQKLFTDGSKIDYYARTAVEAVNKAKYITGKPNLYDAKTMSYDPLSPFTRAEAAVVASRVLKQQKKIPY